MRRRALVPALVTRAVAAAAAIAVVAAAAACESRARVGELAAVDDGGAPPAPLPPAADAAPPGALTAALRAPLVPCSIWAMDEQRADALYLGCNGGTVYRFDGVRATPALSVGDDRVASLVATAPGGEVWVGAASGTGAGATTELHRFDGKTWAKLPWSGARVTSLAAPGAAAWITTATEIRRWDGAAFATTYTATKGELRACAFASDTAGYCVGTEGLAVAWDGATWSPIAAAPWPSGADVLGVELDPFGGAPTFFWSEPANGPNGEDASIHAATREGGAFHAYAATTLSFTSFGVARKRTGHAVVSGHLYFLLSVEEQYGQALVFDPQADAFRTLCGPVLAFSSGAANTRVGGYDGLLATIVGSGGDQLALSMPPGAFEPHDLSVAPGGAAWARVEDVASCGSITDRLVRWEGGEWRPVAAPEPAQSGRGLAAIDFEHAFTLTAAEGILAEYRAGEWAERGTLDGAWSLAGARADDLWIGGYTDQLAHYDGASIATVLPAGEGRQITDVDVDASGVVWMVALGYTQADARVHAYRFEAGKRAEWDLGIESYGTHVSALDGAHAWLSGRPAKAWTGAGWKNLPFDASNVWARTPTEVYFTFGGDVFRWNGATKERVFHGVIPIRAIDGSKDAAMAIGPGGLTIELGAFPRPPP